MATQPLGGLGAMTPARPSAPAPQPSVQAANPALTAQRISGLEQEAPEDDFYARALRNKRATEAALTSQIEALKNSLDSRMRPPFDPALMAAASGFLRPTKTGGFGESAGYAAEAYATETDKELARKQAVDKAKLELAQKQAAMQTQNLMFEHRMRMSGYDPKDLATSGTGPADSPPLASAPVGNASAENAPAVKRAPREPRMITQRDINFAFEISPEFGKETLELAKFQRDNFMSTPQGVIDKRTGKVIDTGLESTIETSIPFVGVEKVTQGQLADIRQLNTNYPPGHPQREDQFARYYSANGIGGTSYTPPADGKPSSAASSMKTAAQRELERKGEEETQKNRIIKSEERASLLIDRGQTADTTKQIALDMSAWAKSNPRAFQLMQQANIWDSVLRAIEKGGAPLNISPRTIQGYKLEDDDIEALQMFAQKSAQLTVELRKASRAPGEGATTESEGRLYSEVEALPSDTARVIVLKSELLELRADYDKAAATLWVDWREQNPGKSFDKFRLSSDEFKALRKSYDFTLAAVRKANTNLLSTKKPSTAPQAKQPSGQPAVNQSNERVIDGFIWTRQPDRSWVNTGRKAK